MCKKRIFSDLDCVSVGFSESCSVIWNVLLQEGYFEPPFTERERKKVELEFEIYWVNIGGTERSVCDHSF